MPTIKSRMSFKFDRFQPWTAELAAFDQFKQIFYLRAIQNSLMTCCQVSDRCPLGFLFCYRLLVLLLFLFEGAPFPLGALERLLHFTVTLPVPST